MTALPRIRHLRLPQRGRPGPWAARAKAKGATPFNPRLASLYSVAVDNSASVLQSRPEGVSDSVVGDLPWLLAQLQAVNVGQRDVDDLQSLLAVSPEEERGRAVETWRSKLLDRVASVADATTAGVLANVIALPLARYLGVV